jgi:hypothetical protein
MNLRNVNDVNERLSSNLVNFDHTFRVQRASDVIL